MTPAVIDLDAAHLTLGTAAAKVKILKGINLQIGAGETVGVLGAKRRWQDQPVDGDGRS
jgi:putative ABC transport system ATP-binding protein